MVGDSTRPLVASTALALCAAVLGSVITLVVTGSVLVPDLRAGTTNQLSTTRGLGTEATQSLPLAQADESKANKLDESAAHVGHVSEAFDEVRQSLQAASDERSQLARSIASLTQQIEVIQSDTINLTSRATLEQTVQNEPEIDLAQTFSEADSRAQRRVSSLVAAGLDETSAQSLLAQQDQYQLARLELVDLAEREGWAESERFDTQLDQLNEQRLDLRAELGDEGYDRYLYEAGRNNRVVIESVIPGSEAANVGLQVGDTVMNYANERIFSTRELQRATREGERGELVDVSVSRQGQSLFFDVPRGPLGVSLGAQKENPS